MTLKEFCKKKSISQADLSRLTGIKHQRIRNCFSTGVNRRNFKQSEIDQIRKGLSEYVHEMILDIGKLKF